MKQLILDLENAVKYPSNITGNMINELFGRVEAFGFDLRGKPHYEYLLKCTTEEQFAYCIDLLYEHDLPIEHLIYALVMAGYTVNKAGIGFKAFKIDSTKLELLPKYGKSNYWHIGETDKFTPPNRWIKEPINAAIYVKNL